MKLYRLMKADADGKPLVGTGSMMLGVRPTDPTQPNKQHDVPAIIGTDAVRPGDGGLSCNADAARIPIRSRKLLLWSIETDSLPSGLLPREAGVLHYLLEPIQEMPLDSFQQLLADTRDLWQRE